MKTITTSFKKQVTDMKHAALCSIHRGKALLAGERGDFYISDAVKIIIAVVLGALLLTALTNLFNTTVIPRITQEITQLFGS